MEKTFSHVEDQSGRLTNRYTVRRLDRLKGKIWALTLEEAEKYFEMAEFAQAGDEQEQQEIEKIKFHLQRRIDKLTRRELFEKTEMQHRMRLQLLEREMDRARASVINTQSKVSNSLITLKELEGAIGGWKDLPTDRINEPEQPVNQQLSVSIMQSSESQKGVQTEPGAAGQTYTEIYHNIAELKSTDNTEEYDNDLSESNESVDTDRRNGVDNRQERPSIKQRVYKRCFENLNWVVNRLEDLKHLVWD